MARDSGSFTLSNPPVVDPLQVLTATATNNTTAAVITYTTASDHNLKVGQPVVTKGFANAWLNYNPDSGIGNGTPAIVASITSPTVFTVKLPAVVATDSSAVSGTVVQSALVSNSPYATLGQQWLPTTAQTNVKVAHEWSNSFPIQPNDDRTTGTVLSTTTAPVGNGTQVTYTVGSGHGLVAGQVVTIQGVTPKAYNLDTVTIASTTGTTIVFNSTLTAPVTSFANGAIVSQYTTGGSSVTVASATGATSGTKTITYTTNQNHNLSAGQAISVIGSSNINYNVRDAVITTTAAKTITVNAPSVNIVSISGTNGSGVVGDTTNVLYNTGTSAHGLAVGDLVTIYNMVPVEYNGANKTVIAAGLTNTTFAVANTTVTTVTAFGQAIENSGTFTAPATVSVGDSGWNATYAYPSGPLVVGLDSHEIVNLASYIAGDSYPTLTVPNVVGLYNTPDAPAAIRSFKAAGFTNVTANDSIDSTAGSAITAVSGNGTIWTYSATAHGLVPGEIVTVNGVGAFNVKNAVITTKAANTFSIANTTVPTALSGLTGSSQGAWTSPNTLPISAVSIAAAAAGSVATATTTVAHGLKVGDIIGIGGTTTATGFEFAYLPGSVTSTNYAADTLTAGTAVASVLSPTSFTFLTPALASTTAISVTDGNVHAYNGIVIAQSLTAGTTSTTPSTVGTVTALPGSSSVQY